MGTSRKINNPEICQQKVTEGKRCFEGKREASPDMLCDLKLTLTLLSREKLSLVRAVGESVRDDDVLNDDVLVHRQVASPWCEDALCIAKESDHGWPIECHPHFDLRKHGVKCSSGPWNQMVFRNTESKGHEEHGMKWSLGTHQAHFRWNDQLPDIESVFITALRSVIQYVKGKNLALLVSRVRVSFVKVVAISYPLMTFISKFFNCQVPIGQTCRLTLFCCLHGRRTGSWHLDLESWCSDYSGAYTMTSGVGSLSTWESIF